MTEWTGFPDSWTVTRVRPRAVPSDFGHGAPAAALAAAGGLPVSAPDEPLLVAVNDPARSTQTAVALQAVRAAAAGRSLRVVVASGTHVHSAEARATHERMLRSALSPSAEVRWHAAAEEDTVDVNGVRADPWLAEARDVVAIGSVEPHWFAGLSGAYKTVAVGLVARSVIERSHSRAVLPGVRPLGLSGNPVHAAMARDFESLAAGRAVLGLQHVGPRWVAGPPLDLASVSLRAARARWLHEVPRPVDFLIACVEPPFDRSLYQADKGLKNSQLAVREGGAAVIDAPCPDGIGPPWFRQAFGRDPLARFDPDSGVWKDYVLGDHKVAWFQFLRQKGISLAVVSERLQPDSECSAGLSVLAARAQAVDWLGAHLGESPIGIVVEEAGHMVVHVAEHASV